MNVMPQNNRGLIPVVIGVTGHRDIPLLDFDVLQKSSHKALREIEAHTPNSPHVLVSCIAEGADRIAANCALNLGWTLGVVLPAAVDVYERDFASQQSKDEFHRLLNAAAWVEVANDADPAKSNYTAASIRLMQQSQLLLAYWDSKAIGLTGGTSYVVDLFLSEIAHSGKGPSGNMQLDARPVFHILTQRLSDPSYILPGKVGDGKWLTPNLYGAVGTSEIDRWWKILRHADLFNLNATIFYKSHFSLIERSREWLDGKKPNVEPAVFPVADNCGWMFSIADAMSVAAQNQRDRIFLKLIGLAMLAITFEQIYANVYSHQATLGLAIFFGVAALFIYKQGKKERIENCYLDYRSLAEACRVQYFWGRAGIQASAANYFLPGQSNELEWLRQAVRSNELSNDVGSLLQSNSMLELDEIRIRWVENQRDYFLKAAERDEKRSKVWSRRASVLFALGVTTVVILALIRGFLVEHFGDMGDVLAQCTSLAYGLLFAAAGLIKVYQGIKAFNEHSKSYRKGNLLMQRANQRLVVALNNSDTKLVQQIFYEIGCESLDENGDWLLLHRDRPVEVPLG